MKRPEHQLKKILELSRDHWDHPAQRRSVRENFRQASMCRTAALGGEVYASAAGEKVFYHTCTVEVLPELRKSGDAALAARGSGRYYRIYRSLASSLTMPDVFWPVFKAHRHLQHDLPALGAAVLVQQWAWNQIPGACERDRHPAHLSEAVSTIIRTST